MTEIRGCTIPEDLYYWPEKHVWVAPQEDGSVLVGVTDVAQHLAHAIISALPKRAGRPAKKGRSLGTIESGKWVGPVTSPVTGEVIESNPALATDPGIVNVDPYGAGWYMRIMPADWEADVITLVTGAEGVAAYEAFLESEGIECE